MTTLGNTPAPNSGAPHRRDATRLTIALTLAACALLAVNALHIGPSWMQWAASLVAVIAALAVMVTGELGWERTLSAAQRAGLIDTDRPDRSS